MTKKQQIIQALRTFARQRPKLEYCNYGDPVAYRSEMRSIIKDLKQAMELLKAIEWRDSISAEDLLFAARDAYAGRLSIVCRDDGDVAIDYCVGQYWPTEYRRAVCAVCASALWAYTREHCMPSEHKGSAGDYLRASLRRAFGRGIANRWFN